MTYYDGTHIVMLPLTPNSTSLVAVPPSAAFPATVYPVPQGVPVPGLADLPLLQRRLGSVTVANIQLAMDRRYAGAASKVLEFHKTYPSLAVATRKAARLRRQPGVESVTMAVTAKCLLHHQWDGEFDPVLEVLEGQQCALHAQQLLEYRCTFANNAADRLRVRLECVLGRGCEPAPSSTSDS